MLLAATLATTGGAVQAAVLTFDGNICNVGNVCGNGSSIDQSYGDSALVDVQYNRDITNPFITIGDPSAELSFWLNDYNELANVAWGGQNDSAGTPLILLKPLGGNSVKLNGFDLGAWPHNVLNSQITIVDGLGSILFSSGPITIGTGDLSTHFNFALTSANGLGIQWGPSGFNVGIDNIDFTISDGAGVVPEPSSWVMMLAGFGLVGGALRSTVRHRPASSEPA
jgi:hypothetical protein